MSLDVLSLGHEILDGLDNAGGDVGHMMGLKENNPGAFSHRVPLEGCGLGQSGIQSLGCVHGNKPAVGTGRKRCIDIDGMSTSPDPKRGKEKQTVEDRELGNSLAAPFQMGVDISTKPLRFRRILKMSRASLKKSTMKQVKELDSTQTSFKAKEEGHTMPPTSPCSSLLGTVRGWGNFRQLEPYRRL